MSNTNKDSFADRIADATAPVVADSNLDAIGQPTPMVIDAAAESPAEVTTEHDITVMLINPGLAQSTEVTEEHEIAAFVNPTDYEDYWRSHFYGTLYYVSGLVWNDYKPAYRLGFDAYFSNHGRSFEEVESALARSWEAIKGNSQLLWPQAKHAVRDGWLFVQSAVTGTPDRHLQ